MKMVISRFVKVVLLLVILSITAVSCSAFSVKYELVNLNGQTGFIYKGTMEDVTLDGVEYSLYPTIKENIKIQYESMNLDNEYLNKLLVEGSEFHLESQSSKQLEFVQNEMEVLGLNVSNETLSLTIESGLNEFNTNDTFQLRNVKVIIGDYEIWSNEFSKANYENTPILFGNSNLSSNYRSGYSQSRTFTFAIPADLLKYSGRLLNLNQEFITYNKTESKQEMLKNEAYIDFNVNIEENDLINSDFQLEVDSYGDSVVVTTYLDGIEIPENLDFQSTAWSSGNHVLTIKATNQIGYVIEKSIPFTLGEIESSTSNLSYRIFETGLNQLLSDDLDNLGVEVTIDELWSSPLSKYAIQNYVINDTVDDQTILWEGIAPTNRTVYMQLFNYLIDEFETVSVDFQESSEETVQLGYSYKDTTDKYLENGIVNMRIVSQNIQKNHQIDARIYHLTDTQYMTQKGASVSSYISDEAKEAFNSMADYLIEEYNSNQLIYTMTTGDYVQSVSNGEKEWSFVMAEFFNPLFEASLPFGVLSGNHDIGALFEVSTNGVNAFDSDLYYDYFNQFLGSEFFEESPLYQDSFEDNRSHYDLVEVNGHEMLFLYLGWGSSKYGIHVSSKDIEYAKNVLQNHSNKTVVLLTHEYMGNKGHRTFTGEHLYSQLVEDYDNISFVFSGHINGTSSRVDHIDTDGDGITDRQVFQMLTNFQEEEELFGASYIRRIGLDFSNNQMLFDLYSPYFKDNDIFVAGNAEVVKNNRYFTYDYDLDDIGFGLITYSIG